MIAADEYRKSIAEVERLLEGESHEEALRAVERMQQVWPGNPRLKTLCASLFQLQESPDRPLDDAKLELLEALELDTESAGVRIELAHYLDKVEDDAAAAREQFSAAINVARVQLEEALKGRIEVSRQLGQSIHEDQQLLRGLGHREPFDERGAEAPTVSNLSERKKGGGLGSGERLPADRARVNVNEDYEVQWWSKKFGVSAEQLRKAVKKVGDMAADVEKHLAKKS